MGAEESCEPLEEARVPPAEAVVHQNFDGVVILLATRNGERFLKEQLDSILSQTFSRWRILVSDDGSTDGTRAVLADFARNHPGRVEFLEKPPVGSAKDNFFRLLYAAPAAEYYALCDQDDVWEEEKLEKLVSACRAVEGGGPETQSSLVFSDLTVVDDRLTPISWSFMERMRAQPGKVSLGSLLVENIAPGCSMFFNRSLIEVFRSWRGSLDGAQMHDWWLALLAQSTGAFSYLDDRLVLYRQHSANTLGSVKRSGLGFVLQKLSCYKSVNRMKTVEQASLFLEAYEHVLPSEAIRTLLACRTLGRAGKLSRIRICVSEGILKQTWPRRLYQLLYI